ncbi:DUF1906 domain-containing protein, partial [bacterium]|nr:DUF1906 domain-containing protein [bacterium]
MIRIIGFRLMHTSSFSNMAIRTTILISVIAVIFSLSPSAQARPSGAVASPGIQAFLQVAPGTGWILFNGDLFWTKDDGSAWLDITPSPADILVVDFLDSSHGWVLSSGPVLSWTSNTGKTWLTRSLDLPELDHLDAPIAQVFMGWRTTSHGWLVFKLATGSNFSRGILFITTDGGVTWSARDLPLGEPATFTDELHGSVSGGPSGDQYFITSDGGLTWEPSQNALPQPPLDDGIVAESMSASGAGWAKWQSGKCTFDVCLQEVKLLSTRDGLRWDPIRLPDGQTVVRRSSAAGVKASFVDPDTITYQGQGFDTCEIPSLSQLQTWWDASPYSAVNLYIGGISRGCSNLALTPSFISQLHAQGWHFFPTWVGPQAACTSYAHKMSWNTTIAYNEGVAEADLA